MEPENKQWHLLVGSGEGALQRLLPGGSVRRTQVHSWLQAKASGQNKTATGRLAVVYKWGQDVSHQRTFMLMSFAILFGAWGEAQTPLVSLPLA